MLVHARTHLTTEVIKWTILMLLASALVLGVLTHVVGQERLTEPRRLDFPPGTLKPIPMPRVERPIWPPTRRHAADFFSLHNVIALHAEDRHREAIEAWNAIEMPPATRTWKHVGQGAASLELNRLSAAARDFKKAIATDRNNAVAEYYLGVTRLAQADASLEFTNTYRTSRFRVLNEVPARRNRQELLQSAEYHLQRAIALAEECDVHAPLLPAGRHWQWIRPASTNPTRDATEPTAGGLTANDLLEALRVADVVQDAQARVERLDLHPQTMQLLNHVTQDY